MELGAERRSAALSGLYGVVVLVDEVELERRRRAQDALGLAGILNARKLDEDAVEALPLHDGLCNAELVDAIAQRHGVLLDRKILTLADGARRQADGEPGPVVDLRALDIEPA